MPTKCGQLAITTTAAGGDINLRSTSSGWIKLLADFQEILLNAPNNFIDIDAGLKVDITAGASSTWAITGDLDITGTTDITYNTGGDHKFETGDIINTGVYYVGANQVVGAQGATVSDPTGGTTVDAEARTAIDTIIDRLQAHGLIA